MTCRSLATLTCGAQTLLFPQATNKSSDGYLLDWMYSGVFQQTISPYMKSVRRVLRRENLRMQHVRSLHGCR